MSIATDRIRARMFAIGLLTAPDATRAEMLRAAQTTPAGNRRRILGTSIKVEKGEGERGVLTAVAYLSPATESGINLCPYATAGCASACLGHSTGRLKMDCAKRARIAKAAWFTLDRAGFYRALDNEISKHAAKAVNKGLKPAVRLNGSSDIPWEKAHKIDGLSLPERHPSVHFYDYTKAPLSARKPSANYTLCFSLSEAPGSHLRALEYLQAGHSAAMVVGGNVQNASLSEAKAVQTAMLESGTWAGFRTVDGDKHDFRDASEAGAWVLLHAKGAALADRSGFVLRPGGLAFAHRRNRNALLVLA